ncbi:hypothetical protein GCM10025876_10540 [Demequina litorisediminis]|uniref:ABC transporter domain-containing protein n=1 Tax=Demequina litorisediminis TaxID=1849022 RepID=A0ABQ6IAV0_9MICO|nr:hypothetical protein GCM10025876_10540 [Demequina litorisediminis]
MIRRGKVVGTAEPTASQEELASLMVGRDVSMTVSKDAAQPGAPMLVVDGLSVVDPATRVKHLDSVSFEIRAGEILAVAGVQGNGQTELAEAIVGIVPAAEGSVTLDGGALTGLTIRQALDSGIGFVPEDRTEDGIVADFTITNNLILDLYDKAPYSKAGAIDSRFAAKNADEQVQRFDVRTTSAEALAGSLSGGNQQKVVLARELARDLKAPDRIAAHPRPRRGVH